MFDWRQLRRWKISEKSLPPGSIVRDRELTTWERHRVAILAVAGLCGLEAFLIAFLLLQRRRCQRAEASLSESEQRMSLAVEAANFGIWIRDLARNEIWASDQWRGPVWLCAVGAAGTCQRFAKSAPGGSRASPPDSRERAGAWRRL